MLDVIKEKIENELRDRIGQEFYLCDLSMELTYYENCNGSWYCSYQKAKDDIKNDFDLCGEFVEWYNSNIGEELYNPFTETELFHCSMMINAVNNVFGIAVNNTEYSDFWNEEIIIDEEFIDVIMEALEDVSESDIFA